MRCSSPFAASRPKSASSSSLPSAAKPTPPAPEVKVSDGTPSLFNDPQLAERVLPAVRQAIGTKNVFESEPSMGAEDFGLLRAPGAPVLLLSVGSVGQPRLDEYKKSGGPPSLHSSITRA